MKDDIEVLDLDDEIIVKRRDNVNKTVNKNIVSNNKVENSPKTVKKVRRVKKKGKIAQAIFCGVSALFILGCIIFYGSRFIKYYRIYNPKVEKEDGSILLAKSISGESEIVYEGSGLYISSGNYIYKGDVKNNYLKFNNMLWRIVRINSDNTIDVILDDYISLLPWNNSVTSFDKSMIHEYLNNDFLDKIDKSMLVKNSFCTDKVSDLSSIKCTSRNSDSYVKFLDITTFLNSVKDKKTYLSHDDEIFWLSDYSDEKIWHVNGVNVSLSDGSLFYEVRPTVRLKNTVYYSKGDGTLKNPYVVSDNSLTVGSHVKLGNDKWIVYDISNDIKLMKEELISEKSMFDKEKNVFNPDSSGSLAKYLNTTYLDSLSYKDMLVDTTWYVGTYKDSLSDIKKKEVKAKVGVPNILDLNFDSSVNGYYTSTGNDEIVWVYEQPLRPSRVTSVRSIRPCIAISKDNISKLKENNGIFELEA